jgi:hypothetical protein
MTIDPRTTMVTVPGIMGQMSLATAQAQGYTNYTIVSGASESQAVPASSFNEDDPAGIGGVNPWAQPVIPTPIPVTPVFNEDDPAGAGGISPFPFEPIALPVVKPVENVPTQQLDISNILGEAPIKMFVPELNKVENIHTSTQIENASISLKEAWGNFDDKWANYIADNKFTGSQEEYVQYSQGFAALSAANQQVNEAIKKHNEAKQFDLEAYIKEDEQGKPIGYNINQYMLDHAWTERLDEGVQRLEGYGFSKEAVETAILTGLMAYQDGKSKADEILIIPREVWSGLGQDAKDSILQTPAIIEVTADEYANMGEALQNRTVLDPESISWGNPDRWGYELGAAMQRVEGFVKEATSNTPMAFSAPAQFAAGALVAAAGGVLFTGVLAGKLSSATFIAKKPFLQALAGVGKEAGIGMYQFGAESLAKAMTGDAFAAGQFATIVYPLAKMGSSIRLSALRSAVGELQAKSLDVILADTWNKIRNNNLIVSERGSIEFTEASTARLSKLIEKMPAARRERLYKDLQRTGTERQEAIDEMWEYMKEVYGEGSLERYIETGKWESSIVPEEGGLRDSILGIEKITEVSKESKEIASIAEESREAINEVNNILKSNTPESIKSAVETINETIAKLEIESKELANKLNLESEAVHNLRTYAMKEGLGKEEIAKLLEDYQSYIRQGVHSQFYRAVSLEAKEIRELSRGATAEAERLARERLGKPEPQKSTETKPIEKPKTATEILSKEEAKIEEKTSTREIKEERIKASEKESAIEEASKITEDERIRLSDKEYWRQKAKENWEEKQRELDAKIAIKISTKTATQTRTATQADVDILAETLAIVLSKVLVNTQLATKILTETEAKTLAETLAVSITQVLAETQALTETQTETLTQTLTSTITKSLVETLTELQLKTLTETLPLVEAENRLKNIIETKLKNKLLPYVSSRNSEPGNVISAYEGAIGWQQGELRSGKVFHLWKKPWRQQDYEILVADYPPQGMIVYSNADKALETLQVLKGEAPGEKVIDIGAFQLEISGTKSVKGRYRRKRLGSEVADVSAKDAKVTVVG